MKGFNFKTNRAGEWYWRLDAGNGEPVADSAEGYNEKSDCEHGASLFKALGPTSPVREVDKDVSHGQGPDWEYFKGKDNQWYWRFRAGNNKIIADGNEGYSSEGNVKRAIDTVIKLLKEG